MLHGGYREGAGRKSAWTKGETQTIRVPVVLADKLLQIARKLDADENVTESIDLTKLKVYQFRGERDWIRLSEVKSLLDLAQRE